MPMDSVNVSTDSMDFLANSDVLPGARDAIMVNVLRVVFRAGSERTVIKVAPITVTVLNVTPSVGSVHTDV